MYQNLYATSLINYWNTDFDSVLQLGSATYNVMLRFIMSMFVIISFFEFRNLKDILDFVEINVQISPKS